MQLNVSSFVFPQIYYRKSNKVCPEQLGICQVPGLGKYKGVAYGGDGLGQFLMMSEKKKLHGKLYNNSPRKNLINFVV